MIDIDTLLHPSSVRQLAEKHWDRTPLHIPGGRDKFKSLGFDLEVFFRLCLDSTDLKAGFYDGQGKHREVAITGTQARSLYESGMTICAAAVDEAHSEISSYARALKRALSLPGPVWANVYLSPKGQGFGLHFDDRSAFVLQIEGSKRWYYSTTPGMTAPPRNVVAYAIDKVQATHPWLQLTPPADAELRQQLLSPGDIFYLPAGTWHRAEAGDYSLAITIGCHSASFSDLLLAVMSSRLDSDVDWRRRLPALPDAQDERSVRAFFGARLEQLKAFVGSLDEETLLAEWRKSVAAASEATAARALERGDRLVVPHRVSSSTKEGQLIVECQGESFALPLELRLFIERLAALETFAAADALAWCEADEELDWGDVREALQTLLDGGIIRRQAGG